MWAFIAVGLGGAAGSWLRWWLGTLFNSFFPTLPLGTLAANVIGGFLMGSFIGVAQSQAYISEEMKLAITTGFLGGLTTFSAVAGESVTLLAHAEYMWAACHIISHVAGTIMAAVCGLYVVKIIYGAV